MTGHASTPADDLGQLAQSALSEFQAAEALKEKDTIQRTTDHIRAGISSLLLSDKDFASDLKLRGIIAQDPKNRVETVYPPKMLEFFQFVEANVGFINLNTKRQLHSLLSTIPSRISSPAAPVSPASVAPVPITAATTPNPPVHATSSPTPTVTAHSSLPRVQPSPTVNTEKQKKTWAERYYGKDIPTSNGVVDSINNVFEAGWLGRINIFSPNFVLRQFLKNDEK